MSLIVHTYLSFLEAARNWLENSSIARWNRESTLYNSAMLAQETNPDTLPARIRWSVEDYYKMAEAGLFDQRRVELIDGEIIEMSPQRNDHTAAVSLLAYALESAFPRNEFWIRTQAPLQLGPGNDPEPDIAVVRGSARTIKSHPTSALLVVEVSDTTLRYDQTIKASLYASYGIQDYWIVNLPAKTLNVYRGPVVDDTQRFGFRYQSVQALNADAAIHALAAPSVAIRVSDILP